MDKGMTDADFKKIVNHGRASKLLSVIVAVYDQPKDYPHHYAARVHIVGKNGRQWASPNAFIVRDTLEEIRAALPDGMHCLGRKPTDDPVIVESYL